MKLGPACLIHWVRQRGARLGCAAGYTLEGGMLSLFVYRGDAEEVPEGPDFRVIGAELEGVQRYQDHGRADEGWAVREIRRGMAGEGAGQGCCRCVWRC